MNSLDLSGQRLLSVLVKHLSQINPGNPETYIGYKEIHEALALKLNGPTYGESLKHQGLSSLADWTEAEGKPGITGIIIDLRTYMPGKGYFRLFGKSEDDYSWWREQVQLSKEFDWSPFLPAPAPPTPPKAHDISKPVERQEITTYRILRDTTLSRRVKALNNYKCQLCGHTIILPDGSKYVEAHHICPLGSPHNGPDSIDNIITLCPNHHAEMDYGVIMLDLNNLITVSGHSINNKYIQYHNENIFNITP